MQYLLHQIARGLHALVHHDGPAYRLEPRRAAQLLKRLDAQPTREKSSSSLPVTGFITGKAGNALVIRTPRFRDAIDLAQDFMRRGVGRVVDLRSGTDASQGVRSALDESRKAFGEDDLVASFERPGGTRPLKGLASKRPCPGAQECDVEVRLIRKETALGRDGQERPGYALPVSLIRTPVSAGKAISVDRLLETSVHVVRQERAKGGPTVYQCADGGHVAATFAAAKGLLEDILQRKARPDRLEDAVLDQCVRIRNEHQATVFRAEDIASLLAVGQAMFDADSRGDFNGLPSFTAGPPKPPRMPVRSGPTAVRAGAESRSQFIHRR